MFVLDKLMLFKDKLLILRNCDPQQIAQQIMSDLEKNANKAANAGKREAFASFDLWRSYKSSISSSAENTGPLSRIDFPGNIDIHSDSRPSEILMGMVQKYIPDENIRLKLQKERYSGSNWYDNHDYISATLSW
ncbi:MAG: hypothetical protein FWF44_06820 [Defluviitaleaceae bacterium]|nr:hypothetical protein [Defluviitaleaceae bacterium]